MKHTKQINRKQMDGYLKAYISVNYDDVPLTVKENLFEIRTLHQSNKYNKKQFQNINVDLMRLMFNTCLKVIFKKCF